MITLRNNWVQNYDQLGHTQMKNLLCPFHPPLGTYNTYNKREVSRIWVLCKGIPKIYNYYYCDKSFNSAPSLETLSDHRYILLFAFGPFNEF